MSEAADIDASQPTPSPGKKIRAEITAYEREYKAWMDRGKGILDRYRDIRPEPSNLTFVLRKYNILWANVRVLKPTLYARVPTVQVERRFRDADPVGRLASEIAQRMGNYIVQTSGTDDVIKQSVQDVCLPGRGTAWITYEAQGEDRPVMEDYTDPTSGEQGKRPKMRLDGKGQPTDEPETEFEKIKEAVNPGYVDWRDMGHSPVRTWNEVTTVWCRRYLDKPQLVDRFGAEKAETVPLDRKIKDENDQTDNIVPQATIYEAWHKPSGKVYWLHKDIPDVLDESDPPIQLEGFWPCPKPLFATMTNETLIPVPDFIYYQDQANELDIITNRIARLTDALKAVGVYDASVPALERILQPNGTPDNMLVPVTGWDAFREKGGLTGAIELVPIEKIAGVLMSLYQARDQIIQTIFQITGIADIIRGSTDPGETLGAQKLKGQYGSINIRDRQAEVAIFCRDIVRLVIECGVQMFEPKLIAEMTMASTFCPLSQQEQMLQASGHPVDMPQSFMQALAMLRNDKMRSFHIDIETDSTVALNDADEKASVTEFVTAIGGFFQSFGPIVQQQPALLPVAGEMLLYATRRFRAGRSMETAIEQAVAKMEQQASQPQPPNPQLQIAQAKAQGETARSQADVQVSQANVMIKKIEAAATLQEAQQAAQEFQANQQHKQIETSIKAGDQQLKAQDQHFQHGMQLREQLHKEHSDHADRATAIIAAVRPSPGPLN